MFKGKLITIEGLEGAGKTTVLNKLQEKLKDNPKFVFTREPGGTELAESLRKIIIENELDPITELFLFEAARREHFVNVIFPALQEGKIVIIDRFTDSTAAYQGVYQNIGLNYIKSCNNLATSFTNLKMLQTDSLVPDLTIFFDIDFKEAQKRIRLRANNNRLDRLSHDEFNTIRNGYLVSFQQREHKSEIKTINTTNMNEREVLNYTLQLLIDYYKAEASKELTKEQKDELNLMTSLQSTKLKESPDDF